MGIETLHLLQSGVANRVMLDIQEGLVVLQNLEQVS